MWVSQGQLRSFAPSSEEHGKGDMLFGGHPDKSSQSGYERLVLEFVAWSSIDSRFKF